MQATAPPAAAAVAQLAAGQHRTQWSEYLTGDKEREFFALLDQLDAANRDFMEATLNLDGRLNAVIRWWSSLGTSGQIPENLVRAGAVGNLSEQELKLYCGGRILGFDEKFMSMYLKEIGRIPNALELAWSWIQQAQGMREHTETYATTRARILEVISMLKVNLRPDAPSNPPR